MKVGCSPVSYGLGDRPIRGSLPLSFGVSLKGTVPSPVPQPRSMVFPAFLGAGKVFQRLGEEFLFFLPSPNHADQRDRL